MKSITVLGSTGSIGTNALSLIRDLGYSVASLSCFHNIEMLEQQIREFKPEFACVYDVKKAEILKVKIKDTKTKLLVGEDGLNEIVSVDKSDLVLNALVGIVGLQPTVNAILEKKDIALANKEVLVAAGSLIKGLAKKNRVKIIPVDSELSAIFQCIGQDKKAVKKLILTASGGPFYGKSIEEVKSVTPKDALNHPNWSMGAKVTIDSATLINKGLEVSEAVFLFDMDVDSIDVLIQRQSILHSLVEFIDNSLIAQLSITDMKIAIQYALTYPNRQHLNVDSLDLAKIKQLDFDYPDMEVFKGLKYAKKALRLGGLAPCMLNAANEVAVNLFLNGKISFLDIAELANETINSVDNIINYKLEDVLNKDLEVRQFVLSKVK